MPDILILFTRRLSLMALSKLHERLQVRFLQVQVPNEPWDSAESGGGSLSLSVKDCHCLSGAARYQQRPNIRVNVESPLSTIDHCDLEPRNIVRVRLVLDFSSAEIHNAQELKRSVVEVVEIVMNQLSESLFSKGTLI